jgi:predicted RNA-binding Zn ribbon-like protein
LSVSGKFYTEFPVPKTKAATDSRHPNLVDSGELGLAFANTAASRPDHRYRVSSPPPGTVPVALATYGELLDWSLRAGAVESAGADAWRREAANRPDEAAAVAARAVDLRDALFRIFTGLPDRRRPAIGDLEVLNQSLGVIPGHRVIPGAGDSFRLGWGGGAEALAGALAPMAWSAAGLLVSDGWRKLRRCAGRDCTWLFIARTARRRLYCDPQPLRQPQPRPP